jgi:hypothetical protein
MKADIEAYRPTLFAPSTQTSTPKSAARVGTSSA